MKSYKNNELYKTLFRSCRFKPHVLSHSFCNSLISLHFCLFLVRVVIKGFFFSIHYMEDLTTTRHGVTRKEEIKIN